jgi:pimeloyl-ACP methyl ester carboxylesterase
MAPLAALLSEESSSAKREAVVSAINGIVGDHLEQTNNPLAIEMGFRFDQRPLDPECSTHVFSDAENPALTAKVMLLVHGLCLNEGHWTQGSHDRARELATRLGYTPVYLRYNTGMPVSENGRALSEGLESLVQHWPVPVSELGIIGHSMGGLVAKSAAHHGRLAGHDWLKQLSTLIFLGTPHHGAPLERGGAWLEKAMGLSPYVVPFLRLGKTRSAGINDLHHGRVTDAAQGFVQLPEGVNCYAIAASLATRANTLQNRMKDRLLGDGLVPVDSALGRSVDDSRSLAIPKDRQWTGFEMGHLELLGHPGVYAQLHDWLQ